MSEWLELQKDHKCVARYKEKRILVLWMRTNIVVNNNTGSSQKIEKESPVILLLGIFSKVMKSVDQRGTNLHFHCSTIHNNQDMNQPKQQLIDG